MHQRTPPRRQQGLALLAVSLLLAILATLAFAMARQGAMAANAVNAQYDTETARYLAEAGVNVARWRSGLNGCTNSANPVGPYHIDGRGTYAATVVKGGKELDIDGVGTAGVGAAMVTQSRRKLTGHNNNLSTLILPNDKGDDTFIAADAPMTPMHSLRYLELTQGRSSILMRFTLPSELNKATIVSADLRLTEYQSNSMLPGQALSAHRLTRDWTSSEASWNTAGSSGRGAPPPWTTPGGDYTAVSIASTPIDGNKSYLWDITALVDGWANNNFPNFGMLLRADGPVQQARFYGWQSSTAKPNLRITYYKAC